MLKILTNNKKYFFPLGLVLILSFSRLIPHPPNFTPVIAVAVMSSYFFSNKYMGLAAMFVSMILADSVIGFYSGMFYVYFSLVLIILIFSNLAKYINFKNLFLYSLSGSVIFFIITNAGVWFSGLLYEKSFQGLLECYYMAIPFFKNTVLSTLIFSYCAFIASSIRKTKLKII